MHTEPSFDFLVIGSAPEGEDAAREAALRGRSVATITPTSAAPTAAAAAPGRACGRRIHGDARLVGPRTVAVREPDGSETRLRAIWLVVARGFESAAEGPSAGELALEKAGLELHEGSLVVDENGQTEASGIYAVGAARDGRAACSRSRHQGRRAICHALALDLLPSGDRG